MKKIYQEKMLGEVRILCWTLLLCLGGIRGLEVTGASDDQMVEEGERMELFCVSQEEWNVCEWTRVSDQ